MKKDFWIIIGTRPEAIKLFPVIKAFKMLKVPYRVCISGQHNELLKPILKGLDIQSDYILPYADKDYSLAQLTAHLTLAFENIFTENINTIRSIIVQGDTTTVFIASLVAFYLNIPCVHVEAGLRSGDMRNPFPEEANRRFVATLADMHFAPTKKAAENLIRESILEEKIFITGNTSVDTLLYVKEKVAFLPLENFNLLSFLDPNKKIILITGHHRENFGEPLKKICISLKELANRFNDIQFIYPVHLNPNVQMAVKKYLADIENIFLIEPLDYFSFVKIMTMSYIILTDSGGIQEEAPSLGKPVLIMREKTERPEGVDVGAAKLVGCNKDLIVESVSELLSSNESYIAMTGHVNPYGDGNAGRRIAEILFNTDFRNT